LAKFKQPKKIIFLDSLPRNAMGKVQKAELRKKYQKLFND
jgi:malonyl-CoA/methylmalonyl-CoA synthetase